MVSYSLSTPANSPGGFDTGTAAGAKGVEKQSESDKREDHDKAGGYRAKREPATRDPAHTRISRQILHANPSRLVLSGARP